MRLGWSFSMCTTLRAVCISPSGAGNQDSILGLISKLRFEAARHCSDVKHDTCNVVGIVR